MRIHSRIKIVLPLIVATGIFASLFSSQELQSLHSEIQETKPSNPTPENIQILGTNDDKEKKTQDTGDTISFDSERLYRLINSYREENNLNKLFINKVLENSAQKKLDDMIAKEYFRHTDLNDNESWYLFQEAGYQYKFAGENLSSGNNTPWQVFTAWQNSPLHNEQLLKAEYLDMGLSVSCEAYKIRNKPACIVVLHLGAK